MVEVILLKYIVLTCVCVVGQRFKFKNANIYDPKVDNIDFYCPSPYFGMVIMVYMFIRSSEPGRCNLKTEWMLGYHFKSLTCIWFLVSETCTVL